MARQRRSYAWALLPEAADVPSTALSPLARRGLEFAKALAEDAVKRSARNYDWKQHEPLTIAQIARQERLSESGVRRSLTQARRELFGEIGDSAIYKRLERDPERDERPPQTCQEHGCEEQLPPHTHGNRRYCARHRTGAARARRHRQAQA